MPVRAFPTLGTSSIGAGGQLTVSVQGLKEIEHAVKRFTDARQVTKIVRSTWKRESKTTVRNIIRNSVRRSFNGKRKLASSYSASATGTHLFNLRMDVYSRLKMSLPHEFGPLYPIRAKSGGYLAIPTKFASGITFEGSKGIKKKSSRTRLRPKHLSKKSTFILNKGGKKIIMMKVDQQAGSRTRKLQQRGFRRAGASIKGQTAIPMFVLKKQVVLRRRTRVRFDFRRHALPPVAKATARDLTREFIRVSRPGLA